jgi:hypothetical protein
MRGVSTGESQTAAALSVTKGKTMAGTRNRTEGLVGLVCESALVAGSDLLNSVEGIDVSSIQDRATCYVRDVDTSYRWFQDSVDAPAPPSVILPAGQLVGTPGRWKVESGGGGGGVSTVTGTNGISITNPAGPNVTVSGAGLVPKATIQNIAAAGPTAITDTFNTLARVNVAAAAAVTLPVGAVGKQIVVKDTSGNASSFNITVAPTAGTIDGNATYTIATNRGSATFLCVSTGPDVWDVI